MSQFSVIILAAGLGSRLGQSAPKQFVDIGGRRLIDFSLDTFVDWADQVIVTVPPGAETEVQLPPGTIAVSGGPSRTESVRNAVERVRNNRVLVHDAARPFVTRELASEVLSALDRAPCAYPVMPVPGSVVVDSDGRLDHTPDRAVLREVQTPQGFHTDLLRTILDRPDPHPHLPEAARQTGVDVIHTSGSEWLFKVTYAPSLYVARYYAERGSDANGEFPT